MTAYISRSCLVMPDWHLRFCERQDLSHEAVNRQLFSSRNVQNTPPGRRILIDPNGSVGRVANKREIPCLLPIAIDDDRITLEDEVPT